MTDTATTWVRHLADKSFHKNIMRNKSSSTIFDPPRCLRILGPPSTVKINKDGEVMWAYGLDQYLSDDSNTGLRSFAYANGVLYAAGKT
jgi:hypothetical protein